MSRARWPDAAPSCEMEGSPGHKRRSSLIGKGLALYFCARADTGLLLAAAGWGKGRRRKDEGERRRGKR